MKYNDLLNELFDLLDNNLDIIKIKKIKNNLVNNEEIKKDLDLYRQTKCVEFKINLFKNPEYLDYLNSKNNINYLIQDIKSKFNVFSNRKCKDESN